MAFGKGLITLPTITGSHSDMPVLLTNGSFATAAIDGGALSLANGGGSLRFYTDDTKSVRLACHVKRLVIGASPDIFVIVKIPSAFTGATIYVEEDSVETSQPAFNANFGRNAARSFARDAFDLDTLENSTGGAGLLSVGSPNSGVIDPWGGLSAYEFNGTDQYLETLAWAKVLDGFLVTCWYKSNNLTATTTLWSQGNVTDNKWDALLLRSGSAYEVNRGSSGSNGGTPKSTWTHLSVIVKSGDNRVYENGNLIGTNGQGSSNNTYDKFQIAALVRSAGLRFDGSISSINVYNSTPADSANYIKTLSDNESNPDTWATMGTWTEQSGAGLTNVIKNFQFNTDLLSRDNKSFQFNTDLLSRDNKSFQFNTDLLSRDNKSFQFNTDLLSAVNVIKNFQFNTDLLSRDNKSFQFNTDLLSRDNKSFQFNTDLLSRDNKSFSIVIDLLSAVNVIKNFQFNTDLLSRDNKSFQFNTDLLSRDNKSFSIVIDLLQGQRVNKSFSIVIDLLQGQRVNKSFSIVIDLLSRNSKSFQFNTDLLQRIIGNHEIVATLLNKVTMDFITRFDLTSRVNAEFTIKLDTLEKINKSFNLVFVFESDTIIKTPAHYTVKFGRVITFTQNNDITLII